MADDVHAPHASTIDVEREADAAAIAEAVLAAGYLAWVGSNATWSIALKSDRIVFGHRMGFRFVKSVGREPRTAVARDVDRLHVTYLAQANPAQLCFE